ncbi:BlaI/MecI/CopY family transcriptional regulator [Intrasporangium mesophilum]
MATEGKFMAVGDRASRARGALERDVLAAVAASATPVSTGDVHAELGPDLAYTTVMTTLVRLHDKGVLRRYKRGRAFVYELATPVEDVDASMAAHRMHRLLEGESDRAGVLARFVADLSTEDGALLASLLTGGANDADATASGSGIRPTPPPPGDPRQV